MKRPPQPPPGSDDGRPHRPKHLPQARMKRLQPLPLPQFNDDPVIHGLTAISVSQLRDIKPRTRDALAASVDRKIRSALKNHNLSTEMQSNVRLLSAIATAALRGDCPKLSVLAFLHFIAALDYFLWLEDECSDETIQGFNDDVLEVAHVMNWFQLEILEAWKSLPDSKEHRVTFFAPPPHQNPRDYGLTDMTMKELLQSGSKSLGVVVLDKINFAIKKCALQEEDERYVRMFACIACDAFANDYRNLSVLALVHIVAALDYFLLTKDEKTDPQFGDDIAEINRVKTVFKAEIERYEKDYLPRRPGGLSP